MFDALNQLVGSLRYSHRGCCFDNLVLLPTNKINREVHSQPILVSLCKKSELNLVRGVLELVFIFEI